MARNKRNRSAAFRFGPALKAFVLCLFIGGTGLGYVWQKNQIYELGQRIRRREAQLDLLKRQNRNLEAHLKVLRSPADAVITECLPYDRSGCSSFQMIESIRAAKPAMKILAVECRCTSEQFSLAIKAGADGFLTREAQASDFVTALRSISKGQTYVSPSIVTKMVNTYVLKTPDGALEDPYQSLSEREREVMMLAAVGHTNREIAATLHLSEQTIHNYRANVMEKLGFHDRVELLKYAIRRGLIDVADL